MQVPAFFYTSGPCALSYGTAVAILLSASAGAQAPASGRILSPGVAPTVDQILSLKRAGSPEISPDGRSVAYTVRETNWDDNSYDTADLAR